MYNKHYTKELFLCLTLSMREIYMYLDMVLRCYIPMNAKCCYSLASRWISFRTRVGHRHKSLVSPTTKNDQIVQVSCLASSGIDVWLFDVWIIHLITATAVWLPLHQSVWLQWNGKHVANGLRVCAIIHVSMLYVADRGWWMRFWVAVAWLKKFPLHTLYEYTNVQYMYQLPSPPVTWYTPYASGGVQQNAYLVVQDKHAVDLWATVVVWSCKTGGNEHNCENVVKFTSLPWMSNVQVPSGFTFRQRETTSWPPLDSDKSRIWYSHYLSFLSSHQEFPAIRFHTWCILTWICPYLTYLDWWYIL